MLVVPDELVSAAQRLTVMGSDVANANVRAAVSTGRIAAAGKDEVSASLTGLFEEYARQFHSAVQETGAAGVQQFAQRLAAPAGSYNSTEAASVASLIQDQINAILDQLNAVEIQIGIALAIPLLYALYGSFELFYLFLKVTLGLPGPWLWWDQPGGF